jgi:type II secretion system protein G
MRIPGFPRHAAFTLIELLIVVAIIAILAAIAVPNFLEAQVRSKVSRAHTDMRAVAVALEAYRTDNNSYPSAAYGQSLPGNILSNRLKPLTSPIAYITSIPADPFPPVQVIGTGFPTLEAQNTFDYWSHEGQGEPTDRSLFGRLWRLASAGPDLLQEYGYYGFYDPTNGAKSTGDIILVQGGGNGIDYFAAHPELYNR